MGSTSPTKAIVAVGLGFGDEGKGATVDYLCRALQADLVVRYCGGAQAGHNVQLPDGRRHTFAQFGAGTLAGAKTYLGPRVVISPATMVPEAEHLRKLGIARPFAMLAAHPNCLVATAYHVAMNRLRETARGDGRHGSCGLGIGETRSYWLRYGQDAVVARDLKDRQTLVAKLDLLRDRCLLEMQTLSVLNETLSLMLYETVPAREADLLLETAQELRLRTHLPDCRVVVFEGAQGVLLDEWRGFHPHTTWSTVTPFHALEMISDHEIGDTTILGVTRAYSTRHGAGPFPTYCPEMSRHVNDLGNPANAWQGAMRCGPLDLVLLEYAARVGRIDGLIVNCLDDLPRNTRICTRYRDMRRIDMPRCLHDQIELTDRLQVAIPVFSESTTDALLDHLSQVAPVVITANGPTHADRQPLADPVEVAGSHHKICHL